MTATCTCCPVHNDLGRALNAAVAKATASYLESLKRPDLALEPHHGDSDSAQNLGDDDAVLDPVARLDDGGEFPADGHELGQLVTHDSPSVGADEPTVGAPGAASPDASPGT